MRWIVLAMSAVLFASPGAAAAGEDPGGEAGGIVTAVRGDVQVGVGDQWKAASVGDSLLAGQVLKTGPASGVDLAFPGDLEATVGESSTIGVTDLLLKTRLERMREKISEPGDTKKVEMQVTPTTGVRGTEQTEEKAEDLKREHYWSEGVK